jgi:hypothetical protein
MRLPALFCILASCGGGGADRRPDASQADADAGAGADADVDAQPDAPDVPTISAAYPVNGAVDVYRTDQVRATFTHAMDPSTITTATFQVLSGGTPMAGIVYYDATAKTAYFSPSSRFDRSASYTAVVTTAVTDMSGRPLAADYSWSFTATAGKWTPAQYLGSTSSSGGLWVTRDPAGDVTATWPTFQGPNYFRTKPSGQNWGPPTTFTTTLASPVLVDVVFNASGDGMAVWQDGSFGAYDCWATRYTQGQWGTPTRIETLSENCAAVGVAIAANGDASVVFRVDSPLALWWNHFDHTTGWGTASQVTTVATGVNFLVAIDSAGITHLAYADDNGVSVTRYTGSAWTTPQSLGTGGNMRMVPDGSGNVTLVWTTFPIASSNLMASRYSGGSSWSSPAQISDGGGMARFPDLAVDGAGNLFVAYGQLVGSTFGTADAWVARYTQGSGWQTAMLLETGSDPVGENVSVALDSGGDAVVAWTAGATVSTTQVYANRYVAGAGWQGATAIATDSGAPAAVFGGDHFPIVLWESFNSVTINASEF